MLCSGGRIHAPRLMHTRSGVVGLLLLSLVLAIALIGPLFAPHSIAQPIGLPGAPPSASAPLGTDYLGRDVLSRVLNGGRSVIGLATLSTVLAYAFGAAIGLVAGYSHSIVDPVLMRSVDILLAFPALIILLLLVSGLGTGIGVLVLGVVLVQLPGIARLIRTATLEVSTRGFVEAAIARGESTRTILTRDVLRNISGIILADVGVRFGYSVILIASMNYLNLGIQPPTADWGLMISENREIIGTNPMAVLPAAALLAALTISVNLVADAYAKTTGVSRPDRATLSVRRWRSGPDPGEL